MFETLLRGKHGVLRRASPDSRRSRGCPPRRSGKSAGAGCGDYGGRAARNGSAEDDDRPHWQFKPGQSGNPAGRPKGSKNRSTLLAEALQPHGQKIVDAAVGAALAGDAATLRACLNKLVPTVRRRAAATLDLPEDLAAEDCDAFLAGVQRALAAGELGFEEAREAAGFVRDRLAAKETALRLRVAEAEAAAAEARAAAARAEEEEWNDPEKRAEQGRYMEALRAQMQADSGGGD